MPTKAELEQRVRNLEQRMQEAAHEVMVFALYNETLQRVRIW